jgi:hypothetical protein
LRQLALARSLGRLGKRPSRGLLSIFEAGSESQPLIKLVGAIPGLCAAAIALYRLFF